MEQPFIVYDSQIFDQQKFGGISRYFCEIMSNLQFNYDIAVRYTENHYLLNSKIKRHGIYIPHLFFKYHQQKLYQSNAKLILKLMQKHAPFVYPMKNIQTCFKTPYPLFNRRKKLSQKPITL